MKRQLLALLILVVLILTGCAYREEISQNSSSVDEKVTVSFSWWGNDDRHIYTMNGVDVFQEENPDIEVKNHYGVWQGFEQRMKVFMESHTESDVMQINYAWLDEYSPDGQGFYDLSELSDYIDFSNFSDSDLQYGIKNGKLNALPIAFNTNIFFYNKDVWDAYGLDYPSSWEDFFTAAEVMKKDNIYPLGMVKKQVFMFMISWFEQTRGKEFFTTDGRLNVDASEMEDFLEFYKRMVDEKVLHPIDEFDRSRFANGEIAATMCWVSDAGNYCKALADNGGNPVRGNMILEMKNPDFTGWYIKPATMYAISAYTDHPEESARLLNFLLNSPRMAELQLSEKGVPVSKSALDTIQSIPDGVGGYEYEASQYMNENMESLVIIKPIMESDDVISAFKQYGDECIYDKLSTREAAEGLIATISEATAK